MKVVVVGYLKDEIHAERKGASGRDICMKYLSWTVTGHYLMHTPNPYAKETNIATRHQQC